MKNQPIKNVSLRRNNRSSKGNESEVQKELHAIDKKVKQYSKRTPPSGELEWELVNINHALKDLKEHPSEQDSYKKKVAELAKQIEEFEDALAKISKPTVVGLRESMRFQSLSRLSSFTQSQSFVEQASQREHSTSTLQTVRIEVQARSKEGGHLTLDPTAQLMRSFTNSGDVEEKSQKELSETSLQTADILESPSAEPIVEDPKHLIKVKPQYSKGCPSCLCM